MSTLTTYIQAHDRRITSSGGGNVNHHSAQLSDANRRLATTGVMLVIFLFAIDATIVSTAMPSIIAKLGGLELYSWVFSVYMLTSALTTPLFGKLADLFSRRTLMLAGIGIFAIGSTLCGAAPSMEMLIVSRAIQGLGGGSIYALAFILIGVLYPPEIRAKMQGIISGIWGLASILGPPAGGVIVQHASWRWAFFVNIPITALAVGFIITGLREDSRHRRTPELDLKGAATLLLALLLLFYGLARSAHSIQPLNAHTLALVGSAAVVFWAFMLLERRAAEPMIPLDLFKLELFRSSAAVATLAAMGVFGAISYLPLYLQGVLGLTASRAGMVLLLLSLGWTAGSLVAGRLVNQRGYRWVSATGMTLLALGFGMFIMRSEPVGIITVLLSGAAIGVGMGLANLTSLVAAQTAVHGQRIGVATSTIMLFRTFGGALAISLMGTVMLARMEYGLSHLGTSELGRLSPELRRKLAHPENLLDPVNRSLIPPELLPPLVTILADSIWYAFLTAFLLMLLGIAASITLGDYTPASTPKPSRPGG